MKKQLTINFIKKKLNLILLILALFLGFITNNYYKNFHKNQIRDFEKLLGNSYLNKTVNSIFGNLQPRFESIEYLVKKGDTLNNILTNLEIPLEERKLVINSLNKNKKILNITENQVINFLIDRGDKSKVNQINFEITKTKNILVTRNNEIGKFSFKNIEKNLKKNISYKEGKIINSLYVSAVNQNIPPNLIVDFARIYGFQIDFQRDIWKNDVFQIIYEYYINSENEILDTGNIIYANLILQGKENPLYFFKSQNIKDHYDERGQSIKKTLMKTPINGARLSSSFGKRKHPILGFTKMHTGTDFAAPMGTPIMASGDGVVTKASWCGGGGNCIKIKHNSVYTTIYAHLSKFGRNIKKGTRVKQGQIIGYVGSTGMSTGPHLHYEVVENGKKVNSQKLKLPSGKTLKGKERQEFEIVKLKTNVLKSELIYSEN
tara:strand:+ start:200 stop:1498 length:1299 start_codon:yes stop_codon:yes gene_type:complete